MLGHRELTGQDYTAMLRRRVWWIVIPVLVAPLIGYLISLKLPNRFTSQTLVLVEQPKVPENFVRPVVGEDLNERLATMKEQILSRTRLQPIIERFGLFKEDNVPVEEAVEMMRKAILVSPVKADFGWREGHQGVPGFYISFTDSNARRAQQVCSEITSMFMQENLHVREQRAEGTTDFLKKQLEEAKNKLDGQDARLAEFQKKYIGTLPGQEQANFNMLNTLNTQLDATTQALSRLQQDRSYVETMLNQQVASWKASQTTNSSPDTLEQQLAQAQSQLLSLQARYTETHPDVIKAKANIEMLKKKIEENEQAPPPDPSKPPPANRSEPPAIQQMRAQMKGLDLSIQEKVKAQVRLQKEIGNYQARIELTPGVEEQYKALTRDYQTALTFYNDLLNKKNQSEMATDLERRQQGEQFRVMDPPNLPEKPSFPDRPLFAAGGLGAGLVIGLGIALMLELKDRAIRTERDIEHFLELPTLALMPVLGDEEGNGNNGRTAKRHEAGHFWKRSRGTKDKKRSQAVGA